MTRCPICKREWEKLIYEDILEIKSRRAFISADDCQETFYGMYRTFQEICFCPHCFTRLYMSLNDAKRILRGKALLVNPMTPVGWMTLAAKGKEETIDLHVAVYKDKMYYATAPPDIVFIENDKRYIMWLFYDELPPSLPPEVRYNSRVISLEKTSLPLFDRDLIIEE